MAYMDMRFALNVFDLEQHLGEPWDCGVVLAHKTIAMGL